MAWDTIGSVFGSIATTLLLMPFIGVNYTVVLITILSAVGAVMLRRCWHTYVICAVAVCVSLFINSNSYQNKTFGIVVNNANSTISVQEIEDLKVLNMNGLPMSETKYQAYLKSVKDNNMVIENTTNANSPADLPNNGSA